MWLLQKLKGFQLWASYIILKHSQVVLALSKKLVKDTVY